MFLIFDKERRQIVEDWPGGGTSHCELDRPFAQTFLKFIEIDVEPGARISDDNDRFRPNFSPRQCPEVFVVVECWAVTE